MYAIYRNAQGEYEADVDGQEKVRIFGTASLEGARILAAMYNDDARMALEARRERIGRRPLALVLKEEA